MKNIYALLTIILLVARPVLAQDGTLDNTFNSVGTATTTFTSSSANSDAYCVGIQPDGKLLVGGISLFAGSTSIAVARYKTDGTLDATFASAGKALHEHGSSSLVTSMALQSDGKILLAGASAPDMTMIVRLKSDGSLDTGFGTGGYVEFQDGFTKILDIRVLSTGKIIGLGIAKMGTTNSVFGLFRRNADGSKDATFGTGGYVLADVGENEAPMKMAVQADGKILATGTVYNNTTKYDMIIARFKADGSWDTTFGTGGKTVSAFAGGSVYEQGNDIVVQTDGKIVVVGRNGNTGGGNNAFMICRYTAAGVLDNTFGTNGYTAFSLANQDEFKSAALMGDGKIVVCGSSRSTAAGGLIKMVVSRFKTDGKLDNTFGTNGSTQTSVISTGACSGEEVRIQTDGKIVIGGWAAATNNGLRQFAVARFKNTGTSGLPSIEPEDISASVFPNPVSIGTTALRFQLAEPEHVSARLISMEGRLLTTFFSEKHSAGEQVKMLELPTGLPTGLYFLQIETEKGVAALPLSVGN